MSIRLRLITLVLLLSAVFPQVALTAPRVAILPGPSGWQAESPRTEIAPEFDFKLADGGTQALLIRSRGLEATSGGWARSYHVTPGGWYRFSVKYKATNVPLSRRSVLARLLRYNDEGKRITPAEYPLTLASDSSEAWHTIAGTFAMPGDCTTVRVELLLRWAAKGEVRWSEVKLNKVDPPEPRKVRLATIRYLPPERTSGPSENLDLFSAMVDKAAEKKPDVICLGEGITVVRTGQSYVDVAEAVPGLSTKRLGELSRKHDCYIVAGIYEREAAAVYNTSVLMGPGGELCGKYRKTCLPREEIEGGLTPGHEYPVFDTRFGKVGMMICWDIHFPEVARRLANNGAELILAPIWGGIETLVQARAIENQVYIVTSTYNPKIRSAVFDRSGNAVVVATKDMPVAVADIDLNERNLDPQIGDWRAHFTRERPPADYELLSRP